MNGSKTIHIIENNSVYVIVPTESDESYETYCFQLCPGTSQRIAHQIEYRSIRDGRLIAHQYATDRYTSFWYDGKRLAESLDILVPRELWNQDAQDDDDWEAIADERWQYRHRSPKCWGEDLFRKEEALMGVRPSRPHRDYPVYSYPL